MKTHTVEARKHQGQIRILHRGTRRLARYRDGRPIEPYTSFIAARHRARAINAAIRHCADRFAPTDHIADASKITTAGELRERLRTFNNPDISRVLRKADEAFTND